jgi:hypothetical protein
MHPQSCLCRMTRPMAWLTARKALWLYHSWPDICLSGEAPWSATPPPKLTVWPAAVSVALNDCCADGSGGGGGSGAPYGVAVL